MTDNISDTKVDRDIPSLKTTKKRTNITMLWMIAGGIVAVIAIAGGIALFLKELENNKQHQVAEAEKHRVKEIPVEVRDFNSTKRRIKKEEEAALPAPSSSLAVEVNVPKEAANGSDQQSHSASTSPSPTANGSELKAESLQTPRQRKLSGDVLVTLDESGIENGVKQLLSKKNTPDTSIPPKDGLDERLKPSLLLDGRAALRPDLTYLMKKNTSIQCGQKTKINTTRPGMVSCIVSKDIYSANGQTLLIEKGSEAVGEQRSAVLQGQAVIEVLWSRIDTPTGVVIDINSLGTDTLGASGHPAWVDNHLAQRFGGAIMLSLIGDLGEALSNRASNSGGEIKLNSTSNVGQDIAGKTLDNTINIPPTAYSNQGSAINIFVARDIDFRSVYELASK